MERRAMGLALRLAIRSVVLTFVLLSAVVNPAGVYGGAGGVWLRVLVGIAVIALLLASFRAIPRPGEGPVGRSPYSLLAAAVRRGRSRAARLAAHLHTSFHRARRRGRVRQVESAVAAAGEDHRLAPENVRTCAEALFRLVQRAWHTGDARQLSTLLSPELLAQWQQHLAELEDADLDRRVEVVGDVRIDYVGLTRGQEEDDRPIVLIEATLGYVEDSGEQPGAREVAPENVLRLSQYWTLGLREGVWTVLSIEERSKGDHHLVEPIAAAVP